MQIKDKLSKVDNSFTVNMYDNGYMVDINGRDSEDEWASARILCNTVEDLIKIVTEATSMPRD